MQPLPPQLLAWVHENFIISTIYLQEINNDDEEITTTAISLIDTPQPSNHSNTNNLQTNNPRMTKTTKIRTFLNTNSSDLSCPFCLESMLEPESLFIGNCCCVMKDKPMHTRCLLKAMERCAETMDDPSKPLPLYIMKCQHCQTHLLGNSLHSKFNDACLQYKKFFTLSEANQASDWKQYLPSVLEVMETVVQSIWSLWEVHPKNSFNPVLATALGILAATNGLISFYANDPTAGTLAVFAYMMAWVETGPSAVFGVTGADWVLGMVRSQMTNHNGTDMGKMVLPSIVSYLIVVVENAKNENAKNEKYQNDAQQYLVAVLSEWKVHDSVLRERLWNIVLSFVMRSNIEGIGYDDTKPKVKFSTTFVTYMIAEAREIEKEEVVCELINKIRID